MDANLTIKWKHLQLLVHEAFFPTLTTEAPLTHEFYPKFHVPRRRRSLPAQRELDFYGLSCTTLMKTQHQRKRGLLGRKPESLCLSVHYSACLHHFLLVHKLPGSQESLMGACLTPNQFNSVMLSVLMSFRAPSSSFLQDVTGNLQVLIILSITLQEYVVFREGGGALVALAAEARALRGGAFLHPPPHPTLCLLRLTANEPSCADKVSTRGQEHPSAFKHEMDRKVDNLREGDQKEG